LKEWSHLNKQFAIRNWDGFYDFYTEKLLIPPQLRKKEEQMDAHKISYLRSHGRWRELASLVKDRDERIRNRTAAIMQKLNPRFGEGPVALNTEEEELLDELYEQLVHDR
jgi:hypothetical protein